ncbi:hypothetical protein [Nocardioides pelophilus]|uniref:hypothetical protein n=1 Tax=Nocardioides pelophilus TaxID=2172019 RepID=UPI00160054E3|nr:hypothetical protein [Nocardioides pelophilus]
MEFKQPYGKVVKDGNGDPYIVNANGRVRAVRDDPDCTSDIQIVVCMDVRHKRNGVWGSWDNASKGTLSYQRYGCKAWNAAGAWDWLEMNSYGLAGTTQEVDCSDLQAVKVRTSVYFRETPSPYASSAVTRSSLTSMVLTLTC